VEKYIHLANMSSKSVKDYKVSNRRSSNVGFGSNVGKTQVKDNNAPLHDDLLIKDGRGRSFSTNRAYKWQYYDKGWKLFSHDVSLSIDKAQKKRTQTTWVHSTLHINFAEMKCKCRLGRGSIAKWVVLKIRKIEPTHTIKDKAVIRRLSIEEDPSSLRFADSSASILPVSLSSINSMDDLKEETAQAPPHRIVFHPSATTGLSVPVTSPLSTLGWAGNLVVNAIRGRKLFKTSSIGRQDIYLEFSIKRQDRRKLSIQTRKCEDSGTDPLFNHTLSLDISSEDQVLTVCAFSKGNIQDSLIGKFKVSLPLIVSYLNPIAAEYNGTSTLDLIRNRSNRRRSLCGTPSILPVLHGKLTFAEHRSRILSFGYNTLRSWFSLTREQSTKAGELLLEFRFFPNPMSKIRESNYLEGPSNVLRRIQRTGKVFGVALQQAVRLSEYECPAPVVDCIEYLLEFGLVEEGLFRVPGDSNLVKSLRTKYDKHASGLVIPGIHEASGLLKLYFREMPDPIIPMRMYQPFLDVETKSKTLKQKLEKYRYLLSMLPQENKKTLHYLIYFLQRVAQLSYLNKMESKNLAIVWAPNLLRTSSDDPMMVLQIPKTIRCIQNFITYFHEIFHASKVASKDNAINEMDSKTGEDVKVPEQETSNLLAMLEMQKREIDMLKSQLETLRERHGHDSNFHPYDEPQSGTKNRNMEEKLSISKKSRSKFGRRRPPPVPIKATTNGSKMMQEERGTDDEEGEGEEEEGKKGGCNRGYKSTKHRRSGGKGRGRRERGRERRTSRG